MKGLVIESKWVDLILDGKKTWELRSSATSVRGIIALIKKGTGHIYGLAKISGVRGPLTERELLESQNRHQVPQGFWQPFEDFKWRFAWELEELVKLDKPVPYTHPNGAVIWVNLSDDVASKLSNHACPAESLREHGETHQASDNRREETSSEYELPVDMANNNEVEPALGDKQLDVVSDGAREIKLSQGNINNGHFYLRSIKDWLPESVIGGSNKTELAPKAMTVDWGGPAPAVSDVAGDKMIFRSRGWVRAFFEKFHLKPGDTVLVKRTGELSLCIRPALRQSSR